MTKLYHATLYIVFCTTLTSCEDFLRIDPPRTDLVRSIVFENEATAKAAVLDLYFQMSASGFASGTTASLSFLGVLSSDEMVNYFGSTPTTIQEYGQFSNNTLLANNSIVLGLWSQFYLAIYKANAAMEGIDRAINLSAATKEQLTGECRFVRALCHFYLVNLFGDVPLVNSSDYTVNSKLARTSTPEVYESIVADLLEAQRLLKDDYSASAGERIRANRGAATALLARVYLYTGEYAETEFESTNVIGNSNYSLPALNAVFLKNSREAILQLARNNLNTQDAATFFVAGNKPSYCALRPETFNSFEAGDARRTTWIGTASDGVNIYRYSSKYKAISATPVTEYSMVLRLAEVYLIRAEARAQQGNLNGALADLNLVRTRASLPASTASSQTALLTAILDERRHELIAEWGHRWLDLKRTGKATEVLSALKSEWKSTSVLYPIPEYELLSNPSFQGQQNPGY